MVDTTPQKRTPSFLTSPEGKKILFYVLLLVVVLAMILYAYFTREAATSNWQDVFKNTSINRKNLVRSNPYKRLLQDLRNMDGRQYNQIRKRERSFQLDATELRTGNRDARGRIISFQGVLTRSIPIELPLAGSPVTVQDLRIRNETRNLTFRVHLVRPPDSPLKPGSLIRGTGVYLMTASSGQNRTPSDQNTEKHVYLMARSVDVLNEQQPDTAQEQRKDETSPEPRLKDGASKEDDASTADLAPPEDYTNQQAVTAYWHKLLGDIEKQSRLEFTDPLFKQMVQEVSKVPTRRLTDWVNANLSPNQLKPIQKAGTHRGDVIAFKGKYVQQYARELLGGPQEQEVIWEYWIRDQKNHITYTFYTLEKADFEISRGSAVQGTGVYLNTQLYDLLNPQGERTQGRHVLVLGPRLRPFFTPSASEQSAPIRWFEYTLMGLIVFFFGLFLVMVYISMSNDPQGPGEYVSDIRKRKLKNKEGDPNTGDSQEPPFTDSS